MNISGTPQELLTFTEGTRRKIKKSSPAKKAMKKARRKLVKAFKSDSPTTMRFYMNMADVAIKKAIVIANMTD
jgi:hypothetical protein